MHQNDPHFSENDEAGPTVNIVRLNTETRAKISQAKLTFCGCVLSGLVCLYGSTVVGSNILENLLIGVGIALPFIGYTTLREERFRQTIEMLKRPSRQYKACNVHQFPHKRHL